MKIRKLNLSKTLILLRFLLLILFFHFGAVQSFAEGESTDLVKVNKSFFLGVAIEGYDPVAYFKAGKAVKGNKEISLKWSDAKWLFSSESNRELFESDPLKYAPQYGGYCAYAVVGGNTVSIDPEAWTIVDDRLYLNYSLSIKEKWDKDEARYIKKADIVWAEWSAKK